MNLFVDSERSSILGHGQSKGDDVHIHMEGNSVEAGDGEIIRVCASQFTMFNNLYHIDDTNNTIRVLLSDTATPFHMHLTCRNHKDYTSLVTDFATVLAAELKAKQSTVHKFHVDEGLIHPSESVGSAATRLLSFTLHAQDTGNGPVNHGLDGIIIQCMGDEGDSYAVLGGERIDKSTSVVSSFHITAATSTITVQGYFPMQRMSDPYVYVRCENTSNNLEQSVLSSGGGSSSADVVNSNILLKASRDVEFIAHSAQNGNEFFLNLQQRRLSHLRLFLTDSKGRRLGRMTHGGTAAGRRGEDGALLKDTQSTLGNLFFTAVLRIEVLRVRNPMKLESAPPPFPTRARESQSVVTWTDYGRPKH
jgi:hypothetical protein